MRGLEISRRFFYEWGLPYLRAEFTTLVDRIAVGRVGGSDIIGADDEYSRDHDWGPRFDLFLTREDYRSWGQDLERTINSSAPETFLGYRHHFFGDPKPPISVDSIDGCVLYHTGKAYPPQNAREWFLRRGKYKSVVEHESWLYFLKHAPVFYDPLGEFTLRQQMFAHYPRDVRIRLIADLCLGIWAAGEYKFCNRHIHRKDPVAIQICLGQFVYDVMRLCFLINDDYAPHEVWIHHEFNKLPEAKTLDPELRNLVMSDNLQEQRELVLQICAYLRWRLHQAGLVDSDKPDYGLRCRDVLARIKDSQIKEM